MESKTGFEHSASGLPDIEWQVASVDTALFALRDQLKREQRAMTSRERPRPGIATLLHGAESARFT